MHVVPKKARVIVTVNEKGEEIQMRLLTKWQVYIDYWKLNAATKKDHFSLLFINQILNQLARHSYFFLLGWILGLQLDCNASRKSREDNA